MNNKTSSHRTTSFLLKSFLLGSIINFISISCLFAQARNTIVSTWNSGTVSFGPGWSNQGDVCPNNCQGGAIGNATLVATPSQGYSFYRWTGRAHGFTSTTITVDFYYGGGIEAEFKKDGSTTPTISTNLPATVGVCSYNTLTLSIQATNATTYQWQIETLLGTNPVTIAYQNIPEGGIYSGTTTTTLRISDPSQVDGAKIRCIAKGDGGGVDSNPVEIVVVSRPTIDFTSTPLCAGKTLALTASASNANAYSWNATGGSFQSVTANPTSWSSNTSGSYSISVSASATPLPIICTNSTTVSVNPLPTVGLTAPTSVCAGTALALTASGGSIYSWAATNGSFISSTGSPVSWSTATAGSYSITVTVNNNTCTNSGTTSVTVVALPVVGISAATSMCAGASVNLSANSGLSYSWTASGGTFTSTSSSPTSWSSTIANGYTITARVNDGTCTNSATTSITVHPLPVVGITAPTSVCLGAPLSLSANSGLSYSWNATGGIFTSTSSSPTSWSSTAASTYTVSITVNNTTCTNSATTSITVHPLPVMGVTSPTSVCLGAPLSLSASGGFLYTWTATGGIFTSTTGSPTSWSATTATTYSITVTINNNTCTNSTTTSVTVHSLPIVGISPPTSVCLGAALNLSANAGLSYSWSATGGAFTSTSGSPTSWSSTIANNYSITVTVNNSTCTNSATTSVTVHPLPVVNLSAYQTACQGQAVNLTASIGNSYSWAASGGSFVSSVGSPVSWSAPLAGMYSMTVTVNNTTCTNSNSTSVSVVAIPIPLANTNTPTLCVGTAITLLASGGQNYSWRGPTGYTSNSQNPTPFIASSTAFSGLYTVSVNNPGCSVTATQTVSVEAVITPVAIVNSSLLMVCLGKTISLSVSGGNVFSWSGPTASGFSSTAQSPSPTATSTIFGGIYTVRVSNRNCNQTATATLSVQINPLPFIILSSDSPRCVGNSLQLSATGGYASYSWSGPNGFSNLTNAPLLPTVDLSFNGTYAVVVGNTFSCTSTASTSVVVNPLPSPTASSNTPVCLNAVIQLNASGGVAYSWSGPGFSSTQQNPSRLSATIDFAGTYTVTVQNAFSCTALATTSVHIPKLSAGIVATPCIGGTIQFTAAGMNSYSWNRPTNNFNSTLQNPSIPSATLNDAGYYFVTARGPSTCSAVLMVPVMITGIGINPSFTVTPTTICSGNTVTLSAASATGTYSWTGPSGYLGSSKTIQISNFQLVNQGLYRLTLASGTCSGYTEKNLLITCVARLATQNSEPIDVEINAYPNPVTHTLTVEVRLKEPSALQLNLVNSVGKDSRTWQVNEVTTFHKTEMNLSDLQGGVYLLQAQAGKQKVVKRVVKIQY